VASAHPLDDAIEELVRELRDVREMGGCSGCRNCLDVVGKARADLRVIDSEAARAAGGELERWLGLAAGRVTATSDCEVCVPTGPYRRFREALEDAGLEETPAAPDDGPA
jgi:hypothetical protein